MAQRIQLRRGTAAEGAQTVLAAGEPGFDTDEKRLRLGDGATAGGHVFSPTGQLSGFTALAPGVAGSTTISPGAPFLQWTAIAQVAVGAGAYTHTLALATQNAQAGSQMRLLLELPDSANPTLEIRNATAAGTLLQSVQGVAGEATFLAVDLAFDGVAWRKISGAYLA